MPHLALLNGSLRRLPVVLIVVAITGFALFVPWTSHSRSAADAAQVQTVTSSAPTPVAHSASPARPAPVSVKSPTAAGRAAAVPARAARDVALASSGARLAAPPAPTQPTASSAGSASAGSSDAGGGTAPADQTPSTGGSSSAGTTSPPPAASGYGCGPALAYLSANAAPGFVFQCPGYAYGHQAMTCVNHAPECAGMKLITINVPCPAAYKNEASNSWVVTNQRSGSIDPYGYCH